MTKSLLFLLFLGYSLLGQSQKQPVDYVNVFTGTSNSRWMLFPGPSQPFGMVKLSPDNQTNVWNGGYEYTVNSIAGFSHIHGMSLSGISYMPFVGKLYFGEEYARLFPGNPDGPFGSMWTAGYRSRFSKDSEKGAPGYYAVHLMDSDVKVELTATRRCGMIQSTFPKSEKSRYILNLDPPTAELTTVKETMVRKIDQQTIEGYVNYTNHYAGNTTVYFRSQFSKPIESMDGWTYEPYDGTDTSYGTDWRRKCNIQRDQESFKSGARSGVVLNFVTEEGEKVTVSTGLSFVSAKNAALNLESEIASVDYDFEQVVAKAQNEWNDLLGTIQVKGRESDKEKFYTNFYRSFTGKNLMSDVNGEYVDMCEEVQTLKAPVDAVYSGDAFWGTQWNLTPLWTLATPQYANSMINSLIELQRHGGWIPEAPVGLEYSPIMGAQHQNALIISAYQKGIAHFDPEEVYEMIKHDYTTPGMDHPCGGYAGNRHMKGYMELGYVSEETGAASNTMEYAFDDYCLAQMAKSLGKKEDYRYFLDRSDNFLNLFNPETGYLQRRYSDGRWYEDFDPFRMGTEGGWNGPGYMEGNAWIYTWYTPQNIPAMVELIGKNNYNNRLEEGFEKGYVDLGNQPNLQAPFIFNYTGKPWLTQKYSRKVAEEFFSISPYQGWVGEEDEGQMGALYALISMGLFQMKAGCSEEPYYDLSSPVFNEIVISLDPEYYPGEQISIKTLNNSPENVYIQSITWNGKKLRTPRIDHAELIKGGELVIALGETPNLEYWK